MQRHLIAAVVVTAFAAAAYAEEPADPALKGLHERWADAMKTLRVPGLAVVAVRGDEVVLLDALGIRNPDGAKPVTPDTYFYIASCTKPYTAAVAAQLADAGKLDLDAPVQRYLPKFGLADAETAKKMTVRDLLSHRPGLNNFPVVFLDAYTGEITDDRYYHFLKRAKPPGKVGYSNVHFTLAGRVIEAVEGKGWREALRDRLFAPAGMTRTTGYASTMYADADVAVPLKDRGDGWEPCPVRKTDRTMHAAGGLGTTARDLGRWLRLNLHGGKLDGKQVLPAAAVVQTHTRQSAAPQKRPNPDVKVEGFGLGWQVGSYKGHRWVSHGGGYTGTAAFLVMLPERKIGVAAVANADGAAGGLVQVACQDVIDRLLGGGGTDLMPRLKQMAEKNRTARGAAPAAAPTPVQAAGLSQPIKGYAGVYENEHWGTLRLQVKTDRLEATIGDFPVVLKSTGADRIQFGIDPRTWRDGRFEVKDGKVEAVVAVWNDHGEVRFSRKYP